MRAATTFLLVAFPFFAFGQSDDARLRVGETIQAPYVSLGEYVKHIAARTNVPIRVDAPIAERKVAIFVADRPFSEVMTRVADTLFLEWVVEKDGYLLRLRPEVEAEEKEVEREETRLVQREIRLAIQNLVEGGRKTLVAYREAYRIAKLDYDESRRDASEAGKKRSQELALALKRKFPGEDRRLDWDAGYALAQLTPSQIEQLLKGEPYFAASSPAKGFGRLAPNSQEMITEAGMPLKQDGNGMMMTALYDPAGRTFAYNFRVLRATGGVSGTGRTVEPLKDPGLQRDLDKLPFQARLEEWGKGRDEAVMKTSFDRPAEAPRPHPTNLMTQSDLLAWVHRKTGIPIVADAFRVALAHGEFPQTGSVESVLKGLALQTNASVRPPQPYVRTENGWLMMRHRNPWRRLRAEIPEKNIEIAHARLSRGGPAIDHYAVLASAMTPEQALNAAQRENFLVDFRTDALASIPALRVWGALSETQRAAAQGEGLPVESLSGASLARAREFLFSFVRSGWVPEDWLVALVPGGSGVPAGTKLEVRYDDQGYTILGPPEEKVYRQQEFPTRGYEGFTGWRVSFSGPPNFNLTSTVPIAPVRSPFVVRPRGG